MLGYSAGKHLRTGVPIRCHSTFQVDFMKACNSSMQLTRAADYGVRVMVHLATLRTDERALLRALADVTDAPESFLSKVLQALSRAGLISSWRGKSGGFLILPRGRAASMLEVVEAIDGRIHLNVCLDPEKGCARRAHCPAHPVWVQAQHAMVQILARTVIADLASQSIARPVRGVFSLQDSEPMKRNSAASGSTAIG
jgi:Rrf2 family protein